MRNLARPVTAVVISLLNAYSPENHIQEVCMHKYAKLTQQDRHQNMSRESITL